MSHRLLYPLLIAAAGAAAYANSFSCPFIFDDYVHIVQDERLQQPLRELLRHSSRPAVALSLWLNYRLGGLDVRGYHLVNLGIHILAGLVLFGIVRRTLESSRLSPSYGSRAAGLAAAIALIWVVHPLQTQSVTYIIQRAESLMGLFYLLTFYCVIRAGRPGAAPPRVSPAPLAWSAAAVLSCALGMGSKVVMVTAPIAILLYDRILLARSWREILRRRGFLHLALFSTWGVLLFLFAGRAEVFGPEVGFRVEGVSPAAYALTQPGVILHYLRLAVWPHPLVLDYAWPLAMDPREILPALAAVGGLLAATAWALRRRPAAGFLGAWFFLTLAPTSSFIPLLDTAFEHRMYLPLAAVAVALVLGADRLMARWAGAAGVSGQRAGLALAAAAVLVLGAATLQRNHDYRSALSIWEDTAAKRPANARAHSNYGAALHFEGRAEEAIAQFRSALSIWEDAVAKRPANARARSHYGAALHFEGRAEEAIAQFREAVRLEPGHADCHNNLGHALEGRGRHEEAIAEFEAALRLAPRHEKAKKGLALALRRRAAALRAEGREEEALQHERRAQELNP